MSQELLSISMKYIWWVNVEKNGKLWSSKFFQTINSSSIPLSFSWLVDLSHLLLTVSSSSNVVIFSLQVQSLKLVGYEAIFNLYFLVHFRVSSLVTFCKSEKLYNLKQTLILENATHQYKTTPIKYNNLYQTFII